MKKLLCALLLMSAAALYAQGEGGDERGGDHAAGQRALQDELDKRMAAVLGGKHGRYYGDPYRQTSADDVRGFLRCSAAVAQARYR